MRTRVASVAVVRTRSTTRVRIQVILFKTLIVRARMRVPATRTLPVRFVLLVIIGKVDTITVGSARGNLESISTRGVMTAPGSRGVLAAGGSRGIITENGTSSTITVEEEE